MLNELLKSRHYRLKIQCLVLLLYTMFNGQGCIYLISLHIDLHSADHVDYLSDEGQIGFAICCLFSLIASGFWWAFCFRVLLQYHYKQNDLEWMKFTKLLAKIGCGFWILSMLIWIGCIIMAEIDGWIAKIMLALIPEWNKSLAIGWIYSMFCEFNSAFSRTTRVRHWLRVVAVFLSAYIAVCTMICAWVWFWWAVTLFTMQIWELIWLSFLLIMMSLILTPFYNFFFIIREQLKERVVWPYYMVCVPCCCGCFCSNRWLKECVPKSCVDHDYVRRAFWLIYGMTMIWLVCTVFTNDNRCMADGAIDEYIYAFRGAAVMIVFYSVLICIELVYAGSIKAPINNNNDNDANAQNLELHVENNDNTTANDGPQLVADDSGDSEIR